MRFEMLRHLDAVVSQKAPSEAITTRGAKPSRGIKSESEFDSYEQVVYLLHIDAEIEHSLMVQYLYAAYSLGGTGVHPKHRETVRKWQNTILGIAKEEMGHLITVQNVLRLIGAPLNFGREDYPSDSHTDLGTFNLRPLTLQSLAKYIWVESPDKWKPTDPDLKRDIGTLPRTDQSFKVAQLFEALIEKIGELPEKLFQADSKQFQASWDEWGRGYQRGERGNRSKAAQDFPLSPDLIIRQMATRCDAVDALKAISHQGENADSADYGPNATQPVSHFARFHGIYDEFNQIKKVEPAFNPTRKVATNPYIPAEGKIPKPKQCGGGEEVAQPIKNPIARLWAHLFNVRYRLALNYLVHSFELAGPANNDGRTPRGIVVTGTFGEMYNMRTIAGMLMETPLDRSPRLFAGPPFQMPYTLSRPMGDRNRWLQHQHTLDASAQLITELEGGEISPASADYLKALRKSDQQQLKTILQFLK